MWYQIEFECSQQIWLVHSVVLLKSNKNQKKRNETASSGLFDASAEKYKNLRAVQIAEKEWMVCWKYRARFPASPLPPPNFLNFTRDSSSSLVLLLLLSSPFSIRNTRSHTYTMKMLMLRIIALKSQNNIVISPVKLQLNWSKEKERHAYTHARTHTLHFPSALNNRSRFSQNIYRVCIQYAIYFFRRPIYHVVKNDLSHANTHTDTHKILSSAACCRLYEMSIKYIPNNRPVETHIDA